MRNTEYSLPGNLTPDEHKEMQRFKTIEDPYYHRSNIIAAVLQYLGRYCWGTVVNSYYDTNRKKSFITGFTVRVDPDMLGRALKICYGEDFTVKRPFIIEMVINLSDSQYLTVSSIIFRWAESDWSTPDFTEAPDIVEHVNATNYIDMANIIHKLLADNLKIEGDEPDGNS